VIRSQPASLPYEISAVTNGPQALIADRYRNKRILLAGDACHLLLRLGAMDEHRRLDGVDLGWNSRLVLQGWGGALLIDSYEARAPAGS